MKNFEYCVYTYKHRLALKEVIKNNEYLPKTTKNELLKRAEVHDMDKMVMYLFWEKKKASKYHRETASHHIDNDISKTNTDYLEAIFDYECAGITKPDKPLNAYDTVLKFYSKYEGVLLPFLKKLHMDSSYRLSDNFGITDLTVTEDDIIREVVFYLTSTEDNIYTRLKDKLCSKEEYFQLFKQRNDLSTIRGLDEAYDKISCEINDFYSEESRKERAKKKLLNGSYSYIRHKVFRQDISTQKSMQLCCECDAGTKDTVWHITIPTTHSDVNTTDKAYLQYSSFTPSQFSSFDELRCMISDIVQLCKDSKSLLDVGDLSVYNTGKFVIGIVGEKIVFGFKILIVNVRHLSCRLEGDYLVFNFETKPYRNSISKYSYRNSVSKHSFSVSVLDYSYNGGI